MKNIIILSLLSMFMLFAQASSVPSGEKEKSSHPEVNPGMAAPAPTTIAGDISDEMLVPESQASLTPVADLPAATTSAPAIHPSYRKGASRQKTTLQESKFARRVQKIRDRILRRHEGGSPVMGILSLVFGIFGFLLLFVALIACLVGAGLPFLIAAGIFGIASVILGAFGLGGDSAAGKGLSVVGLIFGIIASMIFLIVLAVVVAANS